MLTGLLGVAKMLLLVQAAQSTVAGTIRDGESGEALPNAIVALTDIDRSVVSDAGGRYTFPAVPPGPQHVTVKLIGYTPRTLHALVPREGELEINIALRPSPMRLPALVVRSTVTIRGVETGDSTPFPDRGISITALRNHPLLAEADALLGLSGGEVVASPESPSGLHVRGGGSDQTAYLLDGIPVFNPYHAAGTFGAWNPDALERLQLFSASPSPAFPDALAGTVAAVTRIPGSLLRAQGGISTTQARVTLDGPLGASGTGYLVSYRTGFPGVMAPEGDRSYLRGETHDLLGKLETPVLGGRLHLLLYDSGNALDAAGVPDTDGSGPRRNSFDWHSRSFGVRWAGHAGRAAVRLQAWSAAGDGEALWTVAGASPYTMEAERQDQGLIAVVERGSSSGMTVVGVRIQRSGTAYRVAPVTGGSSFNLSAGTPVAAGFFQQERAIGRRLRANLAFSVAAANKSVYLNPQSQLRWQLSTPVALSVSYARSHQFSQSLRNPESVVGNVFPADLYIGVGAPGVPVGQSDRAVVGAEYRPLAGVRLGAQLYLSDYRGLLLVAPRSGEPFATTGFTTGSGAARGFSIDAAVSGTRYGLVASYGWQRTRLMHADSSYTPVHGSSHSIDLGATVFPSTTSSVRLGASAIFGRRATPVSGSFEWESCNLLDRGCEFSGSPQGIGSLGATRLPFYLRLDLTLRKHWHVDIGGRNVELALFGTLTNLLGRSNVLTIANDPATGRPTVIEMRPRSPLVAGIDWRF